MELLKQYAELEQQIYDYFGYEAGWQDLPISDCTKYYWQIDPYQVIYSESLEELTEQKLEDMNYYSADICSTRSFPQTVFRKDDYTMLVADTGCDNNKYLMIFDNAKEIKDGH